MRLFLDSSALAKRYISEGGSDLVLMRCSEADEILLSLICIPEIVSGLNRLKREGKLTHHQYRQLKGEFAGDLAEATVLDFTEAVIQESIRCLEKNAVRGMDAIHVASAAVFGSDLFLSADSRQCKAARQVGLRVEEIRSG